MIIWQWLMDLTGANREAGTAYGFWSGFGGSWILGYLGLSALYLWHHNCHVHRCWRLGRRRVGDYAVCRHHHPAGRVTGQDILDAHQARLP